MRGLAGQSFVQRLFARPIPGRHLHGRVVGQAVGVILRRIARGQSIDSLAQQFDELITDSILPPGIAQPIGQRLGDPQSMIGFPQQEQAGVGRKPVVGRQNLDGTVETRFE